MDKLLPAIRYAVTGIAVGSLAANVTDQLANLVNMQIAPSSSSSTGGAIGRGAFMIVIAGASTAACVLAGDKLMDILNAGVDDPLYRAVYYNTAILGSSNVAGAAAVLRNMIGNVSQMAVPMASPSASTSSTTTSTCSTCPLSK
jgi:hypothetical protein